MFITHINVESSVYVKSNIYRPSKGSAMNFLFPAWIKKTSLCDKTKSLCAVLENFLKIIEKVWGTSLLILWLLHSQLSINAWSLWKHKCMEYFRNIKTCYIYIGYIEPDTSLLMAAWHGIAKASRIILDLQEDETVTEDDDGQVKSSNSCS